MINKLYCYNFHNLASITYKSLVYIVPNTMRGNGLQCLEKLRYLVR